MIDREAAILDFPLPVSSRLVVQGHYFIFLNVDIAVGISLLSCLQTEIYVFEV